MVKDPKYLMGSSLNGSSLTLKQVRIEADWGKRVTLGTDVLLDDKDEFLLESLQQDVCIGRKNVLVISDEEFYLDAIFLRLYDALKDIEEFAVHRMFQPDVEGIVGWFNKLLAEVSIDEARNLDDQPKTIIFMPEITNNHFDLFWTISRPHAPTCTIGFITLTVRIPKMHICGKR